MGPCGLIIKRSAGSEEMYSFPRLYIIGGSLTITNNTNVTTMMRLKKLKSIAPRVRNEGGAEDLSHGLMIVFNKELMYLDVEALELVERLLLYLRMHN